MNDHPALMMAGQKGENMKTSKKECYEMIRNAFECSREYLYLPCGCTGGLNSIRQQKNTIILSRLNMEFGGCQCLYYF